MTGLYSVTAGYQVLCLFGLGVMAQFEFPPDVSFLDQFVSQHTVTIRGVNPELPIDQANELIRGIFEERFSAKQVVSV